MILEVTLSEKNEKILDTLKFYNILDSNIMKEGIAVIKSAANKSCCNSLATESDIYWRIRRRSRI